jgi:hypothetical protein
MKLFWKIGGILITLFVLIATGAGVYRAVKSPLFLLRVIEVTDLPEGAPVSAAEIESLTALPLSTTSLFAIDLREVESRISRHPWIKSVQLQKRFPQTLAVSVQLKTPVALLALPGGQLAYVDSEGSTYGNFGLSYFSDLPQFQGVARENREQILSGLRLLSAWEESGYSKKYTLSTLTWDDERGFRAVVSYPMTVATGSEFSQIPATSVKGMALMLIGRSRAVIDLGVPSSSGETLTQFQRLASVLDYLGKNSLRARHIWADSGKKIIVKMLPSS